MKQLFSLRAKEGWEIETIDVKLRAGTQADAVPSGTICYEAFRAVCTQHNFPPDFPSAEVVSGLLSTLLAHPQFYSVVAELDGRIVGSNFVDERSCICGVGPITVDPTVQNGGIGAIKDAGRDRPRRAEECSGRASPSGRLP